jgi:hypothetical protein
MLYAALITSATAATSWNLAGDYAEATNPNGTWTYGQIPGGVFSALAWNAGTGSYGIAAPYETFVFRSASAVFDFGIAPGQVSLESDWGDAAVRWTAPVAGDYAFTVAVGGSTVSGPGGFGNNFASQAGVRVNGLDVSATGFVSNVKSWSFTVALAAGGTVDTFVINPGYDGGGNNQTIIAVSAVPEPASALLLILGTAGLALCRKASRPA